MKSAGKARSNGLYRHIRTSKEIIRNLLNDSYKNICLCQKKPCTVINAPCKHYIPKKSRELLKEDSCRNLIQYVKRNKPNGRVECSISGLPGCIGAEQCKFYLKKNVHK